MREHVHKMVQKPKKSKLKKNLPFSGVQLKENDFLEDEFLNNSNFNSKITKFDW